MTDVTVQPQATAATGAASAASPAAASPAGIGGYIAGKCPQVVIRDEAAVKRFYAKGATDDPAQLTYQASLVQSTRQCTSGAGGLGITLVVQGRLVAGPMGTSGKVTLPIRVSVMDGNTTLYTDLTNFEADLPAGQGSGQFLFTNNKILVTGGSGGFTSVYIGFEQAPVPAAKGGRKKK